MDVRVTGRVVKFIFEKKYGFIRPTTPGPDVWFNLYDCDHSVGLVKSRGCGKQIVSFVVDEISGRQRAKLVRGERSAELADASRCRAVSS